MTGTIFRQTFRENWRQIIYWGLGLAILGFYILAVIPDVDALEQYTELLNTLPPIFTQMLGATDAAFMATPEGFVSFGFFGYTLLIMAVYAVIAGLNLTANEEEAGILDVVMSLPVARWRLVIERFAAFTVIMLGIIVAGLLGLWVGTQASTLEVNMGRVVESAINMIPGTLLMVALTVFATTMLRRKSTAVAIVSAVIIGSYFIDAIGRSVNNDIVAAVRSLSFFTYYDSQGVMQYGLNVGNVVLLLVVTALLILGSVWAFERRDIGV